MTNPNNAIGTNAAYSGRTSANAFNDVLSVLSRGIVSGWACAPDSGMSVVLGGDGTTRDVAIAEDNIGNRTTINNISGSPVSVTIATAPVTNSRIDLIVAYVDNPPEGSSTITDNYEACGLITVQGVPAATPLVPEDGDIRTAITGDGASGTTAYYVVLAQVTVASGTTDIDATMIQQGGNAGIANQNIQDGTIKTPKFAQYAVSNAVKTAGNLTPAGDTPSDWINLFGTEGYFITRYTQAGIFTNQPTAYGVLETIVTGNTVSQRWSQNGGRTYYRNGAYSGGTDRWWSSDTEVAFRQLADNAPSKGNITMSSGYTKVSGLTFAKKSGGVVCWQINFTSSSSMTAGAEYTIASMPSGYRPPVVSYGSGYHSDGRPIFIRVYENGNVTVTPYVNISSVGNNLISGSYYV